MQAERERIEQLGDEIATLAAEIHAAMARFLRLVAEFDELGGWSLACCKSCAHWVSWRCGIGLPAAREHVRVARRLRDLPLTRAAFERGELSYSKVRAISRMDNIEREAELVELAHGATACQLDRMVRAYRGVVAVETGQIRDERFLSVLPDDDGSFVVRGRLSAEEGALVQAALRAASDVLHSEAAETHPTTVDALLRLVETYEPASPARGVADRYQVVIHVDEATLSTGEGVATLDDGTPMPVETVRRVCCDAAVIVASERNGRPLRMGRKTRTVPPALRRALRRRDGGCQFPGCGCRHGVQAHHIDHWGDGGPTDLDNLVELCPYHHRLLHEGRYRLVRQSDGRLTFYRSDGRAIPDAPRPRRTDPGCVPGRNRQAGVAPDATTCGSAYAGDRLDLPYAVDALLRMAPIPEPSVGVT